MPRLLALTFLALALPALAAEPAKKDEPRKQDEVAITDLRVQTLPEQHYIYQANETTFEKIMQPIEKVMPIIDKALDDGKIRPAGSFMFVYKGVGQDMTKPFTLEVGYIADAKKSKPVDGLQTRKLEAGKVATVIFQGPVTQIARAYQKAMPAVIAAGLTPTGETREYYLHWESPTSPNNVIQIQIVVK